MSVCTPRKPVEDGSKHGPFIARQGLTLVLDIRATGADGCTPFDLSGRVGSGQLRFNIEDPVVSATFTVVITDAPRGLARATISAVDTARLIPGDYVADFEFALTPDDVVGTFPFHIRIVREVTR